MADPKRTPKPSTTAERNIPGAFEGETVTRRRLMTGTAHGLGGLAAAAFTLPALGFAVGPVFERRKATWEAIGVPADFPADTYVPQVITEIAGIGVVGKTTVYVRRRNPDYDPPEAGFAPFVVISTRCMHLGCPVRYVEASQRFICPCHGGVYDFAGKVDGGPPVRPLDRFYNRVRNGKVEVGPRYSVNSQLEPMAVRDPGEDTDGIGKYLYPPRFTTPNLD